MAQALTYRDWTWGLAELNSGAPAVNGTRVSMTGNGTEFNDTSLASAASQQIPVDGTININKNVVERRPPRANGYRQPYYLDASNDNYGITPTWTWSAPLTRDTADLIFAGLFQRCTEGGTTPFVKSFQWPIVGAAWALTGGVYGYPEFSTDEGYFFGLIGNSPLGGVTDIGVTSSVPRDATFTCSSDANEGRLYCVSNWDGLLVTDYASLTAPTPYSLTNSEYFHFNGMSVTIGGTAVVCYGMSLTITPGFKQIPAGGDSCQDIAMVTHEARGYIDVLWDITARTLSTAVETNDTSAIMNTLKIFWGSGADPITTDGDLMFEINGKLSGYPQNQGSEEQIVRLEFQGVKSSGDEDIVVSIANANDRGWQSA